MRRTCLVILSWVVISISVGGAIQASEVTALKIRHKLYDPSSRQLSYELWNDSEQTVTAWRLSLARSDPHGHAEASVLDQDYSDRSTLGTGGSASGPIAPGVSIQGRWRVEAAVDGKAPLALSVMVAAAVFDDLTWQGDRVAVTAILESRAARLEEVGRVVNVLEEQDRSPRSRQAWSTELTAQAKKLRLEGQDLESSSDLGREVAAQLSAIKLQLADWLERAAQEVSVAPNPGEALRLLTRDLRQRYETGMKSIPDGALAVDSDSAGQGGEQ